MAGPFPGMDPYLDDPPRWGGVHSGLVQAMRAALNVVLPDRYVADVDERRYVAHTERNIYPDLSVRQADRPDRVGEASIADAVTLSIVPAPWVAVIDAVERWEPFVEIRTTGDQSRVVTVIEVLSISNKTGGSEGQRLYLQKLGELLGSETHLIEIDLLRSGQHTVAAPLEWLRSCGKWTYLVSLHRPVPERRFQVWPILLPERLPVIPVPLLEGDPDVPVDLQAALNRCYEEGAYARSVDYRRDPPVRLSPEDASWADSLLREKGLRH